MIIALSGYARSGKDTVGLYMNGYKRISFAQPIYDALYILNPLVKNIEHGYTMPLATVVDNSGWEIAKTQYSGTRDYLQRLGTDIGRKMFGEDFWVDRAMKLIDGPNIVFTDTRFPNEADTVRFDYSGLIVRVTRPGLEVVNDHPSEYALDDYKFDEEIINDGTPAQLQLAVANLLRRYNAGSV